MDTKYVDIILQDGQSVTDPGIAEPMRELAERWGRVPALDEVTVELDEHGQRIATVELKRQAG